MKKNKKMINEKPIAPDELILDEMEPETPNPINWSEPQDRGEDLANISDPFVHGPELDAEAAPELPELTHKHRGDVPKFNENLADRFDAERKSRPPF